MTNKQRWTKLMQVLILNLLNFFNNILNLSQKLKNVFVFFFKSLFKKSVIL